MITRSGKVAEKVYVTRKYTRKVIPPTRIITTIMDLDSTLHANIRKRNDIHLYQMVNQNHLMI